MDQQQGAAVALRIEETGQIVWADLDPKYLAQLEELMGGEPIAVSLAEDDDTEGHIASPEVILDVEGHAIALRLPTGADAAALRRGFAAGVVTASIVVGGAAAALTGSGMLAAQQAAAEPAAPVVVPAEAPDTQRAPYILNRPDAE
jgi:hypothetical protein